MSDGSDASEAVDVADASEVEPAAARRPVRRRSRSASTQRWSRIVHAYTSMVALLLVLFFGITGITLNHPEWTLGQDPTVTTETGTFGFTVAPDGEVDYLAVSEHLRDRYGISAEVANYATTGTQGSISYRAPGYAADATFDTETGKYQVTIEQQGFIGVMNDLHKGRDANSSWKWAIDLAGAILVVIALSGLLLQLVLKRRRRSALIVAAIGGVVAVVLIVLTL